MTFQPSKHIGPFTIGLIDTAIAVTPTEQDVALDVFYTSVGEVTLPTCSGLAFSDASSGQSTGFSPYSQQSPQALGGFGSDIPRGLGSRACGGSLGCAIYSSVTPKLRHKAFDTDEVLVDAHVIILGGS